MVEYEYFLNRYSYTSQLLSSYMKNCNWFDEKAFENQSLCVRQQYVKKILSIIVATSHSSMLSLMLSLSF
jgi:hypothetical protein